MRLLLDTDAYLALMCGHEGVAARVRAADEVLLPGVVAGELMFGFRHGTSHARHVKDLERFLADSHVRLLPVTLTTADRFSRLASTLQAKGHTIPTNDLWVAAHAMETGADLLSFDPHYGSIEGIAWVDPGGL